MKLVKLDACGEDMIPLSFTVKPDGQAQIVPNQPVKASYSTDYVLNISVYNCHSKLTDVLTYITGGRQMMMRSIRVESHDGEVIMAFTCGLTLTLPILEDYLLFETAMKVVISGPTRRSCTMI